MKIDKSMLKPLGKSTGTLSPAEGAEFFHASIESQSVDRTLKIHGYKTPDRVPERLRGITEEVLAELQTQADAQVAFRRIPIKSLRAGELILEDESRFNCEAFQHFLAGCREVVLFVQTLGEPVEALRQRLSEDRLVLEGLLLETGGWLAIEQLNKAFVHHLRANIGKSASLTRRLAPGYSFNVSQNQVTWELEEQRMLFVALDAVDFPVRLLRKSYAMIPTLSRSGLYGIRYAASEVMPASDETIILDVEKTKL